MRVDHVLPRSSKRTRAAEIHNLSEKVGSEFDCFCEHKSYGCFETYI